MSATLFGALATAGALGVTHAAEPDHVAGIASPTGRYGDARLSAGAVECVIARCVEAGVAAKWDTLADVRPVRNCPLSHNSLDICPLLSGIAADCTLHSA